MSEREAANFMIKTCTDAYNKWSTAGYDLIQYFQQGIEKWVPHCAGGYDECKSFNHIVIFQFIEFTSGAMKSYSSCDDGH